MNIGLLMVNAEDDILEATLHHNTRHVDCFYALDGTQPNTVSERIIRAHPKCASYTRDADLPTDRYSGQPRDGWRQHLLDQARAEHGPFGNWYLLLHGDEVWTGLPDLTTTLHDGFFFLLPFYIPRAADGWDPDVHPLAQLRWKLSPGWPEFRLFHDAPHVAYDPGQHFNTQPGGLTNTGKCGHPILHYPYRAPDVQRRRAAVHEQTGFDPDNYRHVTDHDEVLWTDERIAETMRSEYFQAVSCDG